MSERDRMRERGHRARTMPRRAFLKGAAGGVVFGLGANILVEAGFFALDKATEAPAPRAGSYDRWELTPDDVAVFGSDLQIKALEAWKLGGEIPPETVERTTFTYLGDDGRHWVDHQGGDVSSRLWSGNDRLDNVPMTEQPDPNFGAWAEKWVARSYHRHEPRFDRCRAIVLDDDHPRLMNYTALLLPDGNGRVRSVTATFSGRRDAEPPQSMSSPALGAGQTSVSL